MDSAVLERDDRTWQVKVEVKKFHAEDEILEVQRYGFCKLRRRKVTAIRPGAVPYEVVTAPHNLLVNVGIDRILDQLIGATTSPYNAANSRIGVGDDTTAATASQTDLQAGAGSTHRQFKLVSSGPTRASEIVTWIATFGTAEGNFHWQEWCIDKGTADGTTITTPMMNRKVVDLGTKTSAAAWQFTVTLTLV